MNSHHHLRPLPLFLLLALLTAFGCTANHTGNDGGGTTGGTVDGGNDGGAACLVDPVLLAARTICHLDDDCPCGAHCELGLCAATCLSDGDCAAGSYCDSFGRCRLQSDTGLIGIQPVAQPAVVLRPATLSLASGDLNAHAVEIDLAGVAPGTRIRLHPDPGLALTCPAEDGGADDAGPDASGDCLFAASPTQRFSIVQDFPSDGGVPQEVHIYAGAQIETVTVQASATPSSTPGGAPEVGLYGGEARLVQMLDAPVGTSGVGSQVAQISAEVSQTGGALALELDDPGHVLSPFDRWSGPLTNNGGAYSLQLPAYRAISDHLLPDNGGQPDVEALIEPGIAELTVTSGETPAIAFQLELTVTGVAPDGGLPSAVYAITLGAVSGDAGTLHPITLDAGDVPTLDPAFGQSPTPWGAAFQQTWSPLPAAGTAETSLMDPVAATLAQGFESQGDAGGPLDACDRSGAEIFVISSQLENAAYMDDPSALGGTTSVGQKVTSGVSESTVQQAITVPPLPDNGGPLYGGLAPFIPDSGFDFTESQDVAWRALVPAVEEAWDALAPSYIGHGGAYIGSINGITGGSAYLTATANYANNAGGGIIPCAFQVSAGTVPVSGTEHCYSTDSTDSWCAFQSINSKVANGTLNYSSDADVSIPGASVDNCAAVAAETGCFVDRSYSLAAATTATNWLPGGGDTNPATLTFSESITSGSYGAQVDTMTWTATLPSVPQNGESALSVTAACLLFSPSDCIERGMCVNPVQGETGDPIAPDLGPAVRANTGDLVCASGPLAADLPLDDNAAGLGDAGSSAPVLLSACQSELAQLHSLPPPSVTGTGAVGLLPLLPDAACVGAGRLIEELEQAVQRAALLDTAQYSYFYDDTMYAEVHRILQRWVKLHAFVAREQIEREPMAQVYLALQQNNSSVVDPLGPNLSVQDDLDLSLAGWTLLLHPHFAPLIAAMRGSTLAAPDYRTRLQPEASLGSFDQGEGLSVAILEALDAQVELATLGVNEVWEASNPPDLTKLPGFEKVMRYVIALRPLAIQLEEKAAAGNDAGTLAWLPAYLQASSSLDARLVLLSQALAKVRSGQSALGINPGEIPLYFSGTAAGAGGEFSAISDYLLGGYPGDTTAWAPALVAQAQNDLSNAQSAYAAQLNRQLEAAQVAGTADDLRLKYGDELLNLCGAIADVNGNSLTADQVLENAPPQVSGATCYKVQTTACSVTSQQILQAYTADDLAYQACVVSQVQTQLGTVGASFADTGFEALAAGGGCTPGTATYNLTGCSGQACLRCTTPGGTPVTEIVTVSAPIATFGAGDTAAIDGNARAACRTLFPNAVDPLPAPNTINSNLANGSCFQGSLGQEALALTSTSTNIDIARSSYADQMDAYNIAMQSCLILDQGNANIESATASFDSTMERLRQGKLIEDSIGYVAGAAVACASAASNVVGDADGSTAAACGAAAVEAAAQIASATIQVEMDNAQSSHDALVQQLQDSIAEQQCANNATQYMVGLHTQALRIQQAIIDFNVAQKQFNNDQASVQQTLDEGRQQLSAYLSRTTVDPTFDFWLSSDIDQLTRDFKLAQRATFLAVRAAEYEFQASLVDSNGSSPGSTFESEVLSAKIPSDLSTVIGDMLQVTATGGILGNRPSQLSVVLSMRDALLQIADKSSGARSQHLLTPSQRFDELLASSKYAVYDQNGVYQGQQIPFDIAPLGASAFGITDTQGIGIFAGTNCAERIWSVFAAIEGTEPIFVGSSTASFAQINLLKANTFYSQWCPRPAPDGTQFQASSVDPGLNLFADPTQGTPGQVSGFGPGSTEIQYTPARLEAFFNVTPTQLSQQGYANGQSNELATRGLFGNYALFLPAGQISQPGAAQATPGLDLNAISDILLRIDYVSVAN